MLILLICTCRFLRSNSTSAKLLGIESDNYRDHRGYDTAPALTEPLLVALCCHRICATLWDTSDSHLAHRFRGLIWKLARIGTHLSLLYFVAPRLCSSNPSCSPRIVVIRRKIESSGCFSVYINGCLVYACVMLAGSSTPPENAHRWPCNASRCAMLLRRVINTSKGP